MYFGCWLDINQPNDARFPIQPSPPDGGPFTGQLLSIADLIRGTHQCMVTEINYDLDPTGPPGISTASSDKLSQRNLAIDHSSNPGKRRNATRATYLCYSPDCSEPSVHTTGR